MGRDLRVGLLPNPGPDQTTEVLNEAFEGALRGDSESLSALLSLLKTRYGNLIFARLRSHRGSAHTATMEDIFQQSMLDFMEKIKTGALKELEESERRDVVRYFQTLCDRKLEDLRKARKGPLLQRQKEELRDDLVENRRIPVTPSIPGVESKHDRHMKLLLREIAALDPLDRLVMERNLAHVPYSEISRETGKQISALESLVRRTRQRLADRIARQSPTARIHQEGEKAPRQDNSCLPKAEEILAAIGELPIEAQSAIDFVHVKGGSIEELAKTLGDEGLEKAQTRLELGYESLSAKLDLPFPQSFEFLKP
jgi:DNA-directed RNA polymerase specialized sigma24 family protein